MLLLDIRQSISFRGHIHEMEIIRVKSSKGVLFALMALNLGESRGAFLLPVLLAAQSRRRRKPFHFTVLGCCFWTFCKLRVDNCPR